jgi:putative transposase
MSHSLVRIWVHVVCGTKMGIPLIEENAEKKIHDLMRIQFEEMGCKVGIINGMPNHVHCLFQLNSEKSISEVIHRVKGNTSFNINKQKLISGKFSWRAGYAAFSVSPLARDTVHLYIENQKIHHARNTVNGEWEKI